ncbi:MAG TPA: POTRA domain-containing protein [Candidatus Acidoferrales bacterium]|nr:POTRA domain-containing protein [Candidatus Acidoferrales bacterium]
MPLPNAWPAGPRAALPMLLIAFAGMLGPSLPAQQAKPTTYAGFEGRTVSRVDISARPNMNVEAFRPLIQLKAAQPFSSKAIQASVQALRQTKLFSQVQVKIEPEQNGLRVTFILEPAYYLGLISFPGATKTFSYTRLLQAVNIPEQSPFTKDLLPQGQKALANFFQTNGYFTAKVTPSARQDDPHLLANLVFQCELGPRARIGHIEIEGVAPAQAEALRSALNSWWARLKRASLKPGQKYSQSQIEKATEEIRSHLRSEGRLAPNVRFESPSYDPRTNRAALKFLADAGPLVSIQVVGAHLWGRTKRRLIPIYQENSVDADLVDEGERNITTYFQSKGYFDAQVHTKMTQSNGEISIVYTVNRGARHRVEGVYFRGNHYFDDDDLESKVSVKKGRFFLLYPLSHGEFSDDLVRKSVDSLNALYRDAGFAGIKIHAQVSDYEPQVDVTFEIVEGPQDKVASFRIVGNTTQSLATLTAGNPLRMAPGKPYSPHLLQLDRNDILASYLNAGYLNARFESSATPAPDNPHAMNVVYTINEGPQGSISDVLLLGQKVTRTDFINGVVAPVVSPGLPLSQGNFFTAQGNLYNLGVFDWVNVRPRRPISNQAQEEVLVNVHEAKRNTIEVGGGIEVIPRSGNIPVGSIALPGLPLIGLGSKFTVSQKSFFGPRFTFQFERHNLRGRAETASFATVLSRLDQTGSFTYSDPYLHGSTWSSLFTLSGERTTENPVFTAAVGQTSFQVQKSLDAKHTKTAILRYTFQITDLSNIVIPDLVLPQDRHIRASTVAGEYIRDSRDNPLNAHHGVFQTLNFGITSKPLGSSANFFHIQGQSAFYIPVRSWLTWANNVRLGFAIPFGDSSVPLSERLFSGGADSLRGFPINGAGPQRPVSVCGNPADPSTCTLISVPVGGDMLFIINSEGRFPIPIKSGLGGVLFYDGGNVYKNVNLPQLVDNYTNTLGVGLRYDTPVGPVRFDVGYRLTRVPGVKSIQYFVTLGQAF